MLEKKNLNNKHAYMCHVSMLHIIKVMVGPLRYEKQRK